MSEPAINVVARDDIDPIPLPNGSWSRMILTSEKAPFGTPSEKGRIGTVHLALGDNHNAYPGGKNVSTLHLDGNCLNASLLIEDTGQYVVKDGKWAL